MQLQQFTEWRCYSDLSNVDGWVQAGPNIHDDICTKNLYKKLWIIQMWQITVSYQTIAEKDLCQAFEV